MSAVLVAALVIGGVAAFRYVTNPSRHFLNYLHAYATQWRGSALGGQQQHDQAWISNHPAAVVAEGRRACTWLASQPDAPNVDPTGRSDMSRMAMRYVARVEGRDLPLARVTKWNVVGGAWNYLCPDEKDATTAPTSLNDD